jgi:hypothetical protein
MCDQANEAWPMFLGAMERLHWSFPDPSKGNGTEDEQLVVYREVRDSIQAVQMFAHQHQVPLINFVRGQRKDDVAPGIEPALSQPRVSCSSVLTRKGHVLESPRGAGGSVSTNFSRQPVAVYHLYFYVQDLEWGRLSSRWARIYRTAWARAVARGHFLCS